jgi:hypothetical protein
MPNSLFMLKIKKAPEVPFREMLIFMAGKPSPNNHKEDGHEENRQKRCGKHSPITPVPTAFCAPLPAPVLITSGMTPRIKARESSGSVEGASLTLQA